MLDRNIINITGNKFRPNEAITRGKVAEILFNVFKFYDGDNNNNYNYAYGNASYSFIDENEFGDFAEAIKQLASNGIINGYENNKFEPNKYITRGELSKIIFTAFKRKYSPGKEIYYDLEKNHWAYNFLIDASE